MNEEVILFNSFSCDLLKQKYLKYANKNSIRGLYFRIYREMEKEVRTVGGVLTIYRLDKNSINLVIKESITPSNIINPIINININSMLH
jgi:hypothetical protein